MLTKSTSIIGILWRTLVVQPVLRYQKWRCDRAKLYLLRHDPTYRFQYKGHQIVRERNTLYQAGVSTMDAVVPDRQTIEERLPTMAWPHKTK